MELKQTPALNFRALSTEVRPYELPIEMEPEWLYVWFEKHVTSSSGRGIRFRLTTPQDLLIFTLIAHRNFYRIVGASNGRKRYQFPLVAELRHDIAPKWSAYASFRVRRDRNRIRDLAFLSLSSQLNFSLLYSKYQDRMLEHFRGARSSLRHPVRVNSPRSSPTGKRREDEGVNPLFLQRRTNEYSGFFQRGPYENIGHFFESARWRSLEGRWKFLRRLDIAACFPSVYTHSVAWALSDESSYKAHYRKSSGHLGHDIDKVFQSSARGETHGIPIGPELSRLFAEIILTRLDAKVHERIRARNREGDAEYEFLRYIDDYFIFGNDLSVVDFVADTIESVLRESGFSMNEAKALTLESPFSNVSIVGRERLRDYLHATLCLDESYRIPPPNPRPIETSLKQLLFSENLASGVDLSSSGISLIERQVLKFLKPRLSQSSLGPQEASEVIEYVWPFIESCCLQYLQRPSVPNAIKVTRLLRAYYQAPSLVCSDRVSIRKLQLITHNYVSFMVGRIIDRLMDVKNADVEIGYFLSLYPACGIPVERSISAVESLLDSVTHAELLGPRESVSSIFLLLSLLRVLHWRSKDLEPHRSSSVNELLRRAKSIFVKVCKHVFSDGFMPSYNDVPHAIQEILLLSALSCPALTRKERMQCLLGHVWSERFLSMLFKDRSPERADIIRMIDDLSYGDSRRTLEIFTWTDVNLDKALLDKQPHLVY